MNLSDFNYNLPTELIAQSWAEPRDSSKLLVWNIEKQSLEDKKFYDILDELDKNDVLVLNKTRVINARLIWKIEGKDTNCEIFLHKQIGVNTWDCLVFPGKKLKIGTKVFFHDLNSNPVMQATITSISNKWRIVEFDKSSLEFLQIVEKIWQVPLPPYIKEELKDSSRYQTVWNEIEWSVAAPTASLHFTKELLEKITKAWVKIEKVLLHVWLGTFMWVETENILDHKMHSEYIELEQDVANKLNKYKAEWKRIIAVWTTAIRVLESFSDEVWILKWWKTETSIFIYPGYKWKFVDAIITNFHLPKSTLLMLVSSFAWTLFTKKAYEYAIKHSYRFFSFWDACFIKKW